MSTIAAKNASVAFEVIASLVRASDSPDQVRAAFSLSLESKDYALCLHIAQCVVSEELLVSLQKLASSSFGNASLEANIAKLGKNALS